MSPKSELVPRGKVTLRGDFAMRFKAHGVRRVVVLAGAALVSAGMGFSAPSAGAAVNVGIGLNLPSPVVGPPVAYAAPPVEAVPPVAFGWGGYGYGHGWHDWHHGGWHHGGGHHGGGHR